MRQKTASQIINQVATEVGIGSEMDPFSTTKNAFKQLIATLNTAGMELIQSEAWTPLVLSHTFVTTADQTRYPLPADFLHMIDQSGWEITEGDPLVGPLTHQLWQYVSNEDIVGLGEIYFRIMPGYIELIGDPVPDGWEINFLYASEAWVQDQTDQSYKTEVSRPSDIVLLNAYLVERLLKLRFLVDRGMDTTAAATQYANAYDNWLAKDKGASPTLRLGGGPVGERLLNECNVSDTGYGDI